MKKLAIALIAGATLTAGVALAPSPASAWGYGTHYGYAPVGYYGWRRPFFGPVISFGFGRPFYRYGWRSPYYGYRHGWRGSYGRYAWR